jgi:coproporphyrinogen III oxidase-like Fe-S oxidoreductase
MGSGYFRLPDFNPAEKFITYIARKKNARCLRFSESASLTVPHSRGDAPTLLYMHVPFCEELCPYCSFNRVEFREELARAYFAALKKEILMYKDLGYNFKAVYAGGGTPTILMDELRSTIELIRGIYDIAEISLETNPNHLTLINLGIMQDMGVNRLSVGVQTFNDALLKSLNRYNKYGSGLEIAERLRRAQGLLDTLNVDMIFNFPGQTMNMLEKDLATIIELGLDQVTYYPLMVSSVTQESMSREFGSSVGKMDKEFYMKVIGTLSAEYRATTAWCFSKNSSMIDEYAVNYEEYAGLGSGAIGNLGGSAYANTFDIKSYIDKVNSGIMPVAAKREFSLQERLGYDFLMKLFGLSLDVKSVSEKHGVNLYRHLWPEILFFMMVNGLEKRGDRLTLTHRGRYYWFIMMREFFIAVNNFRDYCRAQVSFESLR